MLYLLRALHSKQIQDAAISSRNFIQNYWEWESLLAEFSSCYLQTCQRNLLYTAVPLNIWWYESICPFICTHKCTQRRKLHIKNLERKAIANQYVIRAANTWMIHSWWWTHFKKITALQYVIPGLCYLLSKWWKGPNG